MSKTNKLKVYVSDELDEAVREHAETTGENLSALQRRALRELLARETDSITEHTTDNKDSIIDTITAIDLEELPHSNSLERDPEVDWTETDIVSRTHHERLPVINAWLNAEAENDKIDCETVKEMLADEEWFNVSKPTVYKDLRRLREYGVAYPSLDVDPDFDREDLLKRLVAVKTHRTRRDVTATSLADILTHKVAEENGGTREPIWESQRSLYTDKMHYHAYCRKILIRTQSILEKSSFESRTNKYYRIVMETYLDYFESIGLDLSVGDKSVADFRDWFESYCSRSLKQNTSERMDTLQQGDRDE